MLPLFDIPKLKKAVYTGSILNPSLFNIPLPPRPEGVVQTITGRIAVKVSGLISLEWNSLTGLSWQERQMFFKTVIANYVQQSYPILLQDKGDRLFLGPKWESSFILTDQQTFPVPLPSNSSYNPYDKRPPASFETPLKRGWFQTLDAVAVYTSMTTTMEKSPETDRITYNLSMLPQTNIRNGYLFYPLCRENWSEEIMMRNNEYWSDGYDATITRYMRNADLSRDPSTALNLRAYRLMSGTRKFEKFIQKPSVRQEIWEGMLAEGFVKEIPPKSKPFRRSGEFVICDQSTPALEIQAVPFKKS